MAEYNLSLFGFRNINTKRANGLFIVLVMIVFILLPCIFEVPLGLASDAQGKPDISGLMVWKSQTQGRGDAVGFVNRTQSSEGIIEGQLERLTFGVPGRGKPVLFSSTPGQPVAKDCTDKHAKNCRQGESQEKFYKWLHEFSMGIAVGLTASSCIVYGNIET